MNLAMLQTLETDTLITIKKAIEAILDGRLDTSLKVGAVAEFEERKNNYVCRIDKINAKSANVTIIDPPSASGQKWRCSKHILRVKPTVRERVISPATDSPYVPVTKTADHW